MQIMGCYGKGEKCLQSAVRKVENWPFSCFPFICPVLCEQQYINHTYYNGVQIYTDGSLSHNSNLKFLKEFQIIFLSYQQDKIWLTEYCKTFLDKNQSGLHFL